MRVRGPVSLAAGVVMAVTLTACGGSRRLGRRAASSRGRGRDPEAGARPGGG